MYFEGREQAQQYSQQIGGYLLVHLGFNSLYDGCDQYFEVLTKEQLQDKAAAQVLCGIRGIYAKKAVEVLKLTLPANWYRWGPKKRWLLLQQTLPHSCSYAAEEYEGLCKAMGKPMPNRFLAGG